MEKNPAVMRWFYILASVLIISLIVWNTISFFNILKENERAKMQIWAAAHGETALEVIRINTTTPMIVHVHGDDTYSGRNIDSLTLENDSVRTELIEQYASEYQPIQIYDGDQLLQTIYYGNSPIINKLKYYPAVLILIIFLFFAAIYFFNETAKSAEQNRLWAGMAKETAHQIGTPLSSLVGWTEILKTEQVNPEYIKEMEKDIHRLEVITDRFSKVGSIPKLEKTDIVSETQSHFDYLKARSSKLIDFQIEIPNDPIYVNLNPQLYGWTIENLVKNGIDAMRGKGTITLTITERSKKVLILISDTGKGIPKRKFQMIFKPGYTTKKRGWGLGLSLAKRIIEEYHRGKICVIKSTVGKGTTIGITLKNYYQNA
jgi:two-component system, sporulation sensor kinase D